MSVINLLRVETVFINQMLRNFAETHYFRVGELLWRYFVHVVTTNENRQIVKVGKFLIGYDTVGGSFATSSSCSTSPVNKELHLGGEVIVDHILQERNIDTTSGQIRDKHKVNSLASEVPQLLLSRKLIHGTINKVCFESCFHRKLTEILNVVPRCSKDDCLLALLHLLS